MRTYPSAALLAFGALIAAAPSPATAQSADAFYKSHTLTVIGTSESGGMTGLYNRMIGQALAAKLPGKPTVVIQAMPGAGGVVGANYCYNVAPKDGSVICMPLPTMPMSQVLGTRGIQFDAGKFIWLGRAAPVEATMTLWHTSPVKTLEDATKQEVILAATGRASDSYIDPTVLNAVFGTKFKLIMGHKGGGDMDLSLERGETTGNAGPLVSPFIRKPDWIAQKLIHFPYQIALKRSTLAPDVPTLIELARNDEERKMFEFLSTRAAIGRALVAPPGVPADRVAALRKAFDDALSDPAFLAQTKKLDLPIDPMSGGEVEAIVMKQLATPKDIVDKMNAILQ